MGLEYTILVKDKKGRFQIVTDKDVREISGDSFDIEFDRLLRLIIEARQEKEKGQ